MLNQVGYVNFTEEIKREILPLLGVETDAAIAKRYNLRPTIVGRYRNFLYIDPSSKSLKPPAKSHICFLCGKKFRRSSSRPEAKHIFCNNECYNAFQKKRDYDKLRYGPGWQKIKEKILARDKTCQICGYKVNTKKENNLAVHHKVPFRYGGSNMMQNLIALCASCHRKVEFATEEALDVFDMQVILLNGKLAIKFEGAVLGEYDIENNNA